MLPPVEDAVLRNNPKFAALHATLTGTLLNADGSTRNHPNLREHEAATEELKTLQTRNIKHNIIKQSLTNLDPSTTTSKSNNAALPDELLELISILSLQLSSTLPPSILQTLSTSPTLALLPKYIPKLADLISRHLHNQSINLVRLTHPTTNSSFLHRSIPKLAPTVLSLQQSLSLKKEELQNSQIQLVSSALTVMENYRGATELVIRILEQTKHGQISRASRARADLVAATAQQESIQVRNLAVKAKGEVYSEETKEALRAYMLHLRDAGLRLKLKRKDVERVLWGYGVGREGEEGERKARVMKEIARVWVGLQREIEEVRRDLRRLDGRS